MKVLIINSVCGIYSTGKICTEIAEQFINQGHQVKIAFGRDFLPNEYNKSAVRIGSRAGTYLHALKARFFDNAGFGSKIATKRFIKWIKEYDPDVINIHNVHGYYINVEILFNYLKTCGKKIIWTLHDCWAFTGHCAHFDYVNCEKWKTACQNCSQRRQYPLSLFGDSSKKNYQKKKELFTGIKNLQIVTPSNWLAGVVKQSFLGEYPVTVINNGIDLKAFKIEQSDFKEKYKLSGKKIVLGVASHWAQRKGLEDMISLSKILPEDYKIVLAGLSETQKDRLPKNILALGKTKSTCDLAKLYSIANVFVNTTKEEVFGLVNVEALACGTPVVTYNVGGSPETIDENTGRIVDKNDVEGLAKAIIEVVENNTISRSDCMARAKMFDKDIQFKKYLDLV